MKKMILIISLFALAACSSSPKTEEVQNTEPVITEPEATPAPTTNETEPAESVTADTGGGDDMSGGFPDVEGTERSGATCKNGGDERMVSVIDTSAGPCGVVYTKGGNKKTVAYAKNDMGYCDKVYNNILGNLTGAGFDCGGAGAAASSAPAQQEEQQEAAPEETAPAQPEGGDAEGE